MAIDLAGHIVIAGWFGGSISFGGPTLSTASGTDMFVVKLDADGNHLWSLAFGDLATPKAAFPYGVALDASGNVLLVGDFTGPLDFGGGALPLYGGNDIFVAKLDANGSHVWSHSFGSAGGDTATSVAADAAGHVVLTGWHAGTVSFGGLPLSNGATADFYAVGLDAAGGHVWSRGLGQAGFPPVVATGGASEVILTKGFTGPVDLGGGTLTPTAAGSGNPDVLLGKLDATGAHLWSERFGDGFPQKPVSLAVDPTGHVLVAGRFGGTLDFGAGPLAGQSASNAFVARFDASGAHLWSRGWGSGNGTLSDHMVAADAAGHVFVAGGFLGTIDLGAGNMASAGQLDVSMARFDASGTLVWQRQYGGAPMEYATVLSVGPDGSPVIAGEYAGTPDFGDGPLPSGSSSLFVAKVMP